MPRFNFFGPLKRKYIVSLILQGEKDKERAFEDGVDFARSLFIIISVPRRGRCDVGTEKESAPKS